MQENARGIMQIKISPSCSPSTAPRMVAVWPVRVVTSDGIALDWDRFSKIRARHDMRNDLLYTAHAVGSRESRRCEREVGPQKPYHVTRVYPVVLHLHRIPCVIGLTPP